MAKIISLQSFTDTRGNLTVVDNVLPFDIKRVFYIYGVDDSQRGKHRHKKTIQAAVCIQGSCRIINQSSEEEEVINFILDSPSKCLILEPFDYHIMDQFSPDAILMVFASESYDAHDYIYEPYK